MKKVLLLSVFILAGVLMLCNSEIFAQGSGTSSITVTYPNGGEVWKMDSTYNITWTSSNVPDSVKLMYSTDGGKNWILIGVVANTGSYEARPTSGYTTVSDKYLIKVIDAKNPDVYDVSNNTFSITGSTEASINLISPYGYESWAIGSTQYINYSTVNVSYVKIEYSTDNGSTWNTIVDSTTNAYSYMWKVPNTPSKNCLIRVSDVSNPQVYSINKYNFSIVSPSYTITTPNGRENWGTGTNQYINWTSNVSSSYNKIEYSTDNGDTWTTITNSTYSYTEGSYNWLIPANITISDKCLIRISNVDNPSIYDVSDNTFSIYKSKPSITVTSPNGNETWTVGSRQYISYTKVLVSKVKIEYSTDNGTSWNTIVDSTDAESNYSYIVPDSPSKNCLIKVSDASNAQLNDVSNNTFSIVTPSITITTPNGGENWGTGVTQNIIWTSNIASSYVKIEYSVDNGSTWNTITNSAYSYSYGYYNWLIPADITASDKCLIRISDVNSPSVYDVSDNTFSIYKSKPSITISTPNGNENWTIGSTQYIYYTSILVNKVKIEYSTDNGTTWGTITDSTNAGNNFSWVVPNTPSKNCLIRISDVSNSQVSDVSNNTFNIVTPSITITSPNGGENWGTGISQYISWKSNITSSYVKIEYSVDNGSTWNTITNSTYSYSYSSYSWVIPAGIKTSSRCLIKISDVNNSSVYDISDNVFTITESKPSVTLSTPNGNEVWGIGSSQYIYYSKVLVNKVKIEYSTDNGSSWKTIVDSTDANNYYSWTVPNTPSKNCLIRISDANNSQVSDVSNNTFSIVAPSITVTTPNGGENWGTSTNQYIYWTSTSSSSYVKIEYTVDNGSTWNTITSNAYSYSSGSYYWFIPQSIKTSSQCKIRITDVNNSSIYDVSDNVFTITQSKPTLNITSPNENVAWAVGSTQYIYYTSILVNKVKIEYSTDNGTTWKTLEDSINASSYYSWLIPDTPSKNCLLRISDASNPSLYDITNSTFSIVSPVITVTTPNGGESWSVGTSHYINWTNYTGSYYVKIEYSLNNGDTWNTITDNTYSYTTGSYYWSIPSGIDTSSFCLIKISDANNSAKYDISDKPFSIYKSSSSISLSTPYGYETWAIGSTQTIYYSSTNVNNVKIDYSTDNGATWTTIVSSTPASSYGSYQWIVPNTPSKNCFIRVSDVANPKVNGQNNNAFSIVVPSLTISTPNGGETWATGESRTIYWTSTNSSYSYYKIECSVDSGLTWTTIKDNSYNYGSYGYYNWQIPTDFTISSKCLIRVTDQGNSALTDMSDGTFSIIQGQPSVTVTNPNDNVSWLVGSTQYINYTATNVANVKIEYSTDNGDTWKTIIASTPAGGSYNWVVPNEISKNCLIRVSDASDSKVSDQSNYTFSIEGFTMKVTTPNGGEEWNVNTSHYIYWSTNDYSYSTRYAKIEYSTDNGVNWNTISSSSSYYYGSGSYYWTIPSSISTSTHCLVKVTDINTSVSDVSDSVFTITNVPASITVTTPNGGESWNAGTSHYIYWTSSNISSYVNIQYSVNNGQSWTYITDYASNTGSYYWSVPSSIATSSKCLIKITDNNNSSVSDVSDATFTINGSQPSITVTSPNGYESLAVGTTLYIYYTATNVANVKIEYTTDNGTTWNTIVSSTQSGSYYAWIVPDSPSKNCLVRVSDASNSQISDVSNNTFSILKQTITVTSPNGGENWNTGSEYNITWTSDNLTSGGEVEIDYTLNNGQTWSEIGNIRNNGSYYWKIPSYIKTSNQCKIRVFDTTNIISDVSDSVFTITNIPIYITVTSPNGGESWDAGTSHYIYWTSINTSSHVDIQYSLNNGQSWTYITKYASNTGSYYWSIPSSIVASSKCLIKLTDFNDYLVSDVSDSVFTISNLPASITVTTPNGGESWNAGTSHYIYWTSSNTSSYVNIQYSVNNGQSWTYITDYASNTGSYYWSVPSSIATSSKCLIKITDNNNSSVSDVSDATFTINGGQSSITVTSPNGYESMAVGTTLYIYYTATNVANVKIEYTTDNGTTWNTIVSSTPSGSYYAWIVPDSPSKNCLVRVSDASNSQISDVSNNTFSILKPTIVVTSPNGGENWTAGVSYNITWSFSDGASYSAYAKLEYSVDNGSTWNTIVNFVTNNLGSNSYSWSVPSNIKTSSNCLVRVSDYYNSSISDQSNAVFTISGGQPSITISRPYGYDSWLVGGSQEINWNAVNIDSVKIEYTTDGGQTWKTIVNKIAANTGYYLWVVPNEPVNDNAKIRISDAGTSGVTSTSNYFSIVKPSITITSPNGGENWKAGSTYGISWYSNISSSYVNIQYSLDNGTTWNDIVKGTYNTYNYNWYIPSDIKLSNQCLVKITDASNPDIFSVSKSVFYITGNTASISVISPNGNEEWGKESTHQIRWVSSLVENVKIEYSTDNGSSWNTIVSSANAGTGYYYWTLPNTVSKNCLVKVSDATNSSLYGISSSTFSIGNPSITVTFPNGGENLKQDSTYYFTWTSSFVSNTVIFAVTLDGGKTWFVPDSNVANTGSYRVTMDQAPVTDKGKIKIIDKYNTSVFDMSDTTFTISGTQSSQLSIMNPQGGESWTVGSTQYIYWSYLNVKKVKIEFSTDGGQTWKSIVDSVPAINNFYGWVVPNVQSNNCYIRITDITNSKVTVQNKYSFSIGGVPTITVKSPNGSENWTAGSEYNINWTSNNTSSYVKIEYTLNNGQTWNLISDYYYNSGSYYWVIPSNIETSTQCRVRVTDMNNQSVYDVSDNVFTITAATPSITVITPNGSEMWGIGSTQYIYYNSVNVTNVKIEYSTDNGSTWNSIISSTPASSYGYYAWTVPNAPSKNCLIKVSDASNSKVNDMSNNTFSIGTPSITVTYPNGNDSLKAGASINITWTSSFTSSYVKLEYSLDNGKTWNIITDYGYSYNNSYTWIIPSSIITSTQCLVRVSDATNNSVKDVSNAAFTITGEKPSITVVTPNGSEMWGVGSTQYIYYNTVNVANIKIEYSTDNGSTWNTIVSSTPAYSSGSYKWIIPNTTSKNCLVKISDVLNPLLSDVSNSTFSIGTPSITLTYPNGGEVWKIDSTYVIRWTSSFASNYVNIKYSTDGGTTWLTAIDNVSNTGSYVVEIGKETVISNKYLIKIVDANNQNVYDVSNSTFSIINNPSAGTITVTYPNGGETFNVGDQITIIWSSKNVTGNVNIYVSSDNGSTWNTIANNVSNTGTYATVIPDNANPSTNYLIKVSSVNNSSVYDVSDRVFTIKSKPSISVSSPKGNEIWGIGSTQYIYYSYSNVANVKIEYTTDNGSTWKVIISSTPANGYYAWVIPNSPSKNCKVRVSDASNSALNSVSAGTFTIVTPSISITSPKGGEVWQQNTGHNINWTSTGISSYVSIDYSTNSGQTWNTITSSAYNNGSYWWNIPEVSSQSCMIRIKDYYNPSVASTSNLFSIVAELPSVTVNYPNGYETFGVGSTQYIYWTSKTVDNVKIEYTTNNGSSWTTIIASTPASNGYYAWVVPNTPSANCKVRISDVSNSSTYGISSNTFTIVTPKITITTPAGGEKWTANTGQYIIWTNTAVSNYVMIDYSTDGGSTWNSITSYSYNSGSYYWTVPNSPSANCKIRIRDYNNNSISAVSNLFTIEAQKPEITVVSPNGGEQFGVGSTQNIIWSYVNVQNVKIEYTTNNGSTWNVITASTPASNGYYAWLVPDSVSKNCKVRISDVSNSNTSGISARVFSIITPIITLTNPKGGETFTAGNQQYIYWYSNGTTNNVKIEFSSDSGKTWVSVVANTYNYGQYYWTVPSSYSNKCFIRVTDVTNAKVYGMNKVPFTITQPKPSVTLTSPNGGEQWVSGYNKYITWNSSNVNNVKLEYSIDGGNKWNLIIASVTASAGNYNWAIPSNISSDNCYVKVSDAGNSAVRDSNMNAFMIVKPLIVVTSPSKDILTVNSEQSIQWTSSNISPYVIIEFSSDGGKTWSDIATYVYSYNGSYKWIVPNTISDNCVIRIKDNLNWSVTGMSSIFAIVAQKPSVTVVSPNGYEKLGTGNTYNIIWNYTGNIQNVKLDYSTDGGTNWTNIIASTPAANGSYNWTIPDKQSDNCLVRVSDVSNASTNDLSNYPFSIVKPSIVVSSPKAGDSLTVNYSAVITWKASGISNYVNLEYTTDGGQTWITIANSVYNSGSYYWYVPNTPSANCQVRVKDYNNSYIYGISNGTFTIAPQKPSITIYSPYGGENWGSGTTQYITWYTVNVKNVKLDYSTDGGKNWTNIIASTPANNGYFLWKVADVTTTSAKIRISDADNSALRVISNTFSITTPSITVTSPNTSVSWDANTKQEITWNSNGTSYYVTLEYSTNSGVNWNTIATMVGNYGSFVWTVPNAPSTKCKVRVKDYSNPNVSDISDTTFTINPEKSFITVVSPNGMENWGVGETNYITWVTNNVQNVKIEFSIDNGKNWNTIISNTSANTGQYLWTIPDVVSSNCLVRISDVTNPSTYDISNFNFTITKPEIVVTYPNGGEILTENDQTYITWTSKGISDYVTIELSTDSMKTWTSIATNTFNYNRYYWTVPGTPSAKCFVRVKDSKNAKIYGQSAYAFRILSQPASLSLTSPVGNEVWAAGSKQNIYWNATKIQNVKLEYSINNGSSWNQIIASTPASNGYFQWTVPDVNSSFCLVRVSDASNNSLFDNSKTVFTILKPVITVTYPNLKDTLIGGTTRNIYWTSKGVSNNVKIELTTDGGNTWMVVATDASNTGSYMWNVPNTPSLKCKIRITDLKNTQVFDSSDSTFIIKVAPANILITSPAGGESWGINTTKYITWKSISVKNVTIEYKTSKASNTWTAIATNIANTGSYMWTVPNNPSDSCFIRVTCTDAGNTGVKSISNRFSITAPQVTLTSPVGGEVWTANTYHFITWGGKGMSDYVKLDYSTDNGSTWKSIVSGLYNSGSYNWFVPADYSTNCKVRVTDYNLSTVTAQSNAVFTIKSPAPAVTIKSPVGYEVYAQGTTQLISWYSINVENVKIELTTDDGATWSTIIASTPASAGVYSWVVPNTPSTKCKVRISSTGDNTVISMSSYDFTISAPFITVTSPKGGEIWNAGSTNYITWSSAGIEKVKIELSVDNGSTWTVINPAIYNYGYYSFVVPNTPSTLCKVRVSDASSTGTLSAMSNNTFSIVAPVKSLVLNSPNGGEKWYAGTYQYIYWTSTEVSKIKIEYTFDNGMTWNTIADNIKASNGYYYWNVPNTASTNCMVRISDVSDNSLKSVSKDLFTIIVPAPVITVTSPMGGEDWQEGSYQYITWKGNTATNFDLQFSNDFGATWNAIVTGITGNSYYWVVPAMASTGCKIKVINHDNNLEAGISNVFTISIVPVNNNNKIIVLSTPTSFCKGDTINVKFIKIGTFNPSNVFSVQLSDNYGSFYSPVQIGSVQDTLGGAISCIIPTNIVSGTYRIRIVGSYPATIGNDNGIDINIKGAYADFSVSDNIKYLPDGSVSFTFTGDSTQISKYAWSFGDGNSSAAINPVYNYTQIGLYGISLKVTDNQGCISSVEKPAYIRVERLFKNTLLNTNVTADVTSVYFADDNNGFVSLSDGSYLVTLDGGANWIPYSNGNTNMIFSINGIGNNKFMFGANGTIYVSTNNGLTWSQYYLPTNATFTGSSFNESGKGYVVGTNGTILYFDGTNWLSQTTGTSVAFNAVSAIGNKAVAVGNFGTIFAYNGTNWSPVNSGVSVKLNAVKFIGSDTGYVVGNNGVILNTVNGGSTWNVSLSGLDVNFTGITAKNSKIAWAVGNNGIVYQTIDGGNTWERFAVGNTSNLLSVTFAKKNGYITGIGGMVRKFVVDSIIVNPVGINQIAQSENIDIKAYPNPVTDKLYITGNFNGTTYVNISVRDINGKLVQNIINETTNGQLTKELNVSKLGTGIYFIHVQEGDRYWVQKIIKM